MLINLSIQDYAVVDQLEADLEVVTETDLEDLRADLQAAQEEHRAAACLPTAMDHLAYHLRLMHATHDVHNDKT